MCIDEKFKKEYQRQLALLHDSIKIINVYSMWMIVDKVNFRILPNGFVILFPLINSPNSSS